MVWSESHSVKLTFELNFELVASQDDQEVDYLTESTGGQGPQGKHEVGMFKEPNETYTTARKANGTRRSQ